MDWIKEGKINPADDDGFNPPLTLKHYFERFREMGIWRTAAAESIPIEDLEDVHLLNIDRMLRGYGAHDFAGRGVMAEVWLDTIGEEIDRRELVPLEPHASSYRGGPPRLGIQPRDSEEQR